MVRYQEISMSADLDQAATASAVPDPAVTPTMTVEAVCAVFGISRSTGYEAARTGEIRTIRVGRRMLVPTAWVRRTLELDAAAPAGQ
jgi:excisionase family DNA binding protein